MYLSLFKGGVPRDVNAVVAAVWNAGPMVDADAVAGHAQVVAGEADGTLGFALSLEAVDGPDVLGCRAVELPRGLWALRVDEVAFPVGAIAHRHTHSGTGWRHLVGGALRIEAEDGDQVMSQGDSWFEPAETRVRAVAMQETGVTRFVRAMVIPETFVGRSTFQLCQPQDAELSRLQVTYRHFDHLVQVDAG